MTTLQIVPTKEDIFSTGFAAIGSYAMKQGKPQMEAVSQIVSILIARNIANNVDVTNRAAGVLITEEDIYTAGIRSGMSLAQKQGSTQVMFAAFSGIASNILARFTASKFTGL